MDTIFIVIGINYHGSICWKEENSWDGDRRTGVKGCPGLTMAEQMWGYKPPKNGEENQDFILQLITVDVAD